MFYFLNIYKHLEYWEMLKVVQVNLTFDLWFDLEFDTVSKKLLHKWTPRPGSPLKRGITRPSTSSRSKVEYLLKFKMAETAIWEMVKVAQGATKLILLS